MSSRIPILLLSLFLFSPQGYSSEGPCEILLRKKTIRGMDVRRRLYQKKRFSNSPVVASKLKQLGLRFMVLLRDPGVVQRIDEFASFVGNHQLDPTKPWEAREAFSQFLGETTLYRAVTVKDGIHSKKLEQAGLVAHKETILAEGVELISMTPYPEVAMATGLSQRASAKDKVFLYKLKVHVLDTFTHSEEGVLPLPDTFYADHLKIRLGDETYVFPVNSKLEQFIMNYIGPEETIEVREVAPIFSEILWGSL